MNIKKIITGLSLSMLLSSGTANADWGDVYYCQMTNFNKLSLEGENESWQLEKFQFKLDQTKNAMVFGDKGFFQNILYQLTTGKNFPEQEYWYASADFQSIFFDSGKLLIASTGSGGIISVSADCDKF